MTLTKPASEEQAVATLAKYVKYYNEIRLHIAIGYVTPKDKMAGLENEIFKERNRKLQAAREARKQKRAAKRA